MTHKNGMYKGILELGGGTALGQGLVVIATPVITRLYSPAEMGVLGLLMAFVGFVTVGVGLRYELAIVSAADDREADHLLLASLTLTLPTSLLAGAGMLGMIRLNLLSYGELPAWAAAAAALVLVLTGFFTCLRYWFVRQAEFATVGRALALQGAGRAVVPVLLGPVGLGWVGLLLGELTGRIVGFGRMLREALPSLLGVLRPFNAAYLVAVMRKSWKFPAIVLPSSLVDSLAAALPVPLVASAFGTDAAGKFLLIQTIVALPAGLVSASVADVFHSEVSTVNRGTGSNLESLLWKVVRKLGVISLAVYLPMALAAPFAMDRLLGPKWEGSGMLLVVLAPISLVGLVVSPVSRLLFVVNKPESKLLIDAIRLLIPLLSLSVLSQVGYAFWTCISVYSISSSLAYGLYFLVIWRASWGQQPAGTRR